MVIGINQSVGLGLQCWTLVAESVKFGQHRHDEMSVLGC